MILSLPEKATIAEQIWRRKGPSRFPAKHALGLDPGVDAGSREENASK
jgi:hypothetical protein